MPYIVWNKERLKIENCTSKTLFPLYLPTPLKLMKIYVTQRSSRSCYVCKVPARTRIYITFNSTSPAALTPLSFLSFTVSLCVCCPSSKFKAAKSKCIQLIFFNYWVFFLLFIKVYTFLLFQNTLLLLFRELSAKLFSALVQLKELCFVACIRFFS